MKKKIVFAFVVSLFVIVFMPKAVSADYVQSTDDIKQTGVVRVDSYEAVNATLYICKSHTVQNWYAGVPFGMTKEYYQYDSSKYSKGEHYAFGVKNKTIENTYKLFKSTKDGVKMDVYTVDGVISEIEATTQSNVCSDEYNDKILSYEEYESLVNTYNITNNQITVEQLEIQKTSSSSEDSDYTQCKDGWWKCAWKFAAEGSASRHTFGVEDVSALSDIEDMLFSIGNIIFILITAFLGVKYIWGGVDSKYSVKNSLVTLVVSAIVFYGWNAVTNMLDVQTLLTGAGAADKMSMVYKIYNTIMYIINIAAVAGIIYIGIKYMMAGADGKSELKLKGIPVIMGIIMVYGTINLIEFILKIVEGI